MIDQDVIGWSRQITDGTFKSVVSVPSTDGTIDEIWCIVEREINGESVRYIERFKQSVYTHSSKLFTSEQGESTFEGLEHLEGKIVDIVADGVVMPEKVVSNGRITLERNAYSVVVGLPYSSVIEMLDFEIQGATGTVQGNQKRVGEAVLRFHETTGCNVNGDVLPFRNFGDSVLDQPAPVFSGDYRIETLGWNNSITIEQKQPLPFHLLAVIRKVTTNDG